MKRLAILYTTILCCAAAHAGAPDVRAFAPARFGFGTFDPETLRTNLPPIDDVAEARRVAAADPQAAASLWTAMAFNQLRVLDYTNAVDSLRLAIASTNSARRDLGHFLARTLLLDGRTNEAEAVWSGLLRDNPADLDAAWQVVYSRFTAGDFASARTGLGALQPPPDAPPSPLHLRALIDWSDGDIQSAERRLVSAWRTGRADSMVALALAAIHTSRGDEPEAIGWLRRGLAGLSAAARARWLASDAFRPLRASTNTMTSAFFAEAVRQPAPGGQERPDLPIDTSGGLFESRIAYAVMVASNLPPLGLSRRFLSLPMMLPPSAR